MQGSTRPDASGARLRAVIRVHGLGRERARAVAEALRPDDLEAPEWLKIREEVDDGDLVITVEVAGGAARLGSLRNTIDELLSVTYALLRSLEEAAKTL
ncbi:MAG: hypothetical protein GXO15_05075 [Crenarchaeota archaeon]|nr:hypothetical protein [Thermoproteota archaeon]